MGTSTSDAIMVTSGDSDESILSDAELGDLGFRGPKQMGNLSFDEMCMFRNNMQLTDDQMDFLESWCDGDGPNIKYYVHMMNNSNVLEKKCKMVFGAKFTREYLQEYLDELLYVQVERMSSTKTYAVRMKMGANSNNAIMTPGWGEVVTKFKIEKEDICLFSFYEQEDGEFYMLIVILPRPCFLA